MFLLLALATVASADKLSVKDKEISWESPKYATCDIDGSCYIDFNFTNDYDKPLSFKESEMSAVSISAPFLLSSVEMQYGVNTTRTKPVYSWVNGIYKCEDSIGMWVYTDEWFNGNTTYHRYYCYAENKDEKNKTVDILFNRSYDKYDNEMQEFFYSDYNQTGTETYYEIVYTSGSKEETKSIGKAERKLYRLNFKVPVPSAGEFDITLCYTKDDFKECSTLDPYWEAGNSLYRRQQFNMTQTTLVYPANASSTVYLHNGSVMLYGRNCSVGTDKSLYWYYNSTSAIAGLYNATNSKCFWFSTYPKQIDTWVNLTNLTEYYSLDEQSGTATYDSSSNNKDGTITGDGVQFRNGQVYKSYYLSGTDDYINIPTLSLGTKHTIIAWINSSNFYSNGLIIAGASNYFAGWFTVGNIGYRTAGGGGVYATHGMANNTWNQIAIVRMNNATVKFYVNGVLKGSPALDNNNALTVSTIGAYDALTVDYTGNVDDLQIYSRILSAAEIAAIYNSTKSKKTYVGAETTASDVTPPTLTWNWTRNQTSAYPHALNITVSADEAYDVCKLEINGSNVTMSETNSTYAYYNYTPALGNWTYKAYCNDTSGNWGHTYTVWYDIISNCGNNVTDPGEDCDGEICCSDTCTFNSSSDVCRPNAGICDSEELCTGSSATCPTDAYNSTSTCRASVGICDIAETCNGTGITCPADQFNNSATVCHPNAGICDSEELCTGSDANCPADIYNSTDICRTSGGICDIEETCNGTGISCPTDSVEPNTTICRASVEYCDPTEYCTGSNITCPSDISNCTANLTIAWGQRFACTNSNFTLWVIYGNLTDANVTATLNGVTYNLTYNSTTHRYEGIFSSNIEQVVSVLINASRINYPTETITSTLTITTCFSFRVRLWEQVDLQTIYQTNNTIITDKNYNKQLIDPYINDFGYIIARNNDRNATGEYSYCNVPWGSGQALGQLLDIGNWLGTNLTRNLTNPLKQYAGCDKYWLRAVYYNGEANLTLPWAGNYSLYFVDGIMRWENQFAPPQIIKSSLFMQLGEINLPDKQNLTEDFWVSHEELNMWASWTDSAFIWMVTLLPIILSIGLVLTGFPIQLAGLIVIMLESIWFVSNILHFF